MTAAKILPAEHKLSTLAQIALLTPEQFGRMLPDFIAWYEFSQVAQRTEGISSSGFTWIDDGQPGEVTAIYLTDAETGVRHEFLSADAGAAK